MNENDSNSDRPSSPSDMGVRVYSVCLTILAVIALFAALGYAKALIIPIVFALLVSILLRSAVNWLNQRLRFSRALSAAGLMVLMLILLATIMVYAIQPATQWVKELPSKMPEIEYRLSLLLDPLEEVTQATRKVGNLGNDEGSSRVVETEQNTFPSALLSQTPTAIASVFVTFVLIFFMLASGDKLLRKLVKVLPTIEDKRRAISIARAVENKVSRFLGAMTLVNIGLGSAVAVAAYFVGLPHPIVWGFIAFVLNYIPYLGPFTGAIATSIAGILTFDSTLHALAMPAIYIGFNIIEGNFITPTVMGKVLTLNPMIVFISLLLWGWLWGVIGIFLAVPILAVFKIICDHIDSLKQIGEFMSDENADPDEAT